MSMAINTGSLVLSSGQSEDDKEARGDKTGECQKMIEETELRRMIVQCH